MALTYALGIRDGFYFSAGAIDYVINYRLATKPLLLVAIGIVYFFIYFGIFYFMITKFNLKTPGREDDEEISLDVSKNSDSSEVEMFAKALGGIENLVVIDSCITRLRLNVKDNNLVNDKALKSLGAKGVLKPTPGVVQVVLGQKAELIANELKKIVR